MRASVRVLPILLGIVASGCLSQPRNLEGLSKGKPAPPVEGIDAAGTTAKLAEYRGQVVLLHFWHAA